MKTGDARKTEKKTTIIKKARIKNQIMINMRLNIFKAAFSKRHPIE